METKSQYMLLVIGERQERLFYGSYAVAVDCQRMFRERGKVAVLMQYDPKKDDYTVKE